MATTTTMPTEVTVTTHDVVVVGAGSAGLQAAQTLGRMGRRTVVLSDGRHRNDPATTMHNFLGHDGTAPADLRASARLDALAYPAVSLLDVAATSVTGVLGDFVVTLADGGSVRARRVLLATGVRDTLPDVAGLAENFGDLVAHCPFCHGHELGRGGRGTVGVLADGTRAIHLAGLLDPLAAEVVLLRGAAAADDGGRTGWDDGWDDGVRAGAATLGARVRAEVVVEVRRKGDELLVVLEGGGEELLSGLFVGTEVTQAAPFAEQLGLELTAMGAVVVDQMGRTSVPGVHAAGDLAATPGLPMAMASVLTAAAAGLMAAAGCVQDAAAERLTGPARHT